MPQFGRAKKLAAGALLLLLGACGDDPAPGCKKPADCVTVAGANTCKVVGGRGRCVIACTLIDGKDNCPATYRCGGTADDGSQFCTST